MASIPPIPQTPAGWAWAVALGALAMGVAVSLWGDKLHRLLLGLAGAGVGALLGGLVAERLGVSVLAGRVSGGFTLALVGLVAANLLWATMASALGLLIAGWALAGLHAVPASDVQVDTFPQWLHLAWQAYQTALVQAWNAHSSRGMMVLVPAGAVPMLLGLLRPRLARILMTALLGSAGIVFGAVFGAAQINAGAWTRSFANAPILGAVAAGVMVFGMSYQYVRAIRAERKELAEQAESDAKPAKASTPDEPKKKKATSE